MIQTHRFTDGTLAVDSKVKQDSLPTLCVVGQLDIAAMRAKAGKPQSRDSDAYTMALDIVKAGVGGEFFYPVLGKTLKVTQDHFDGAKERLNKSPNKISFIAEICASRVENVNIKHGLGDVGPWVVLKWCKDLAAAESYLRVSKDIASPRGRMINVHIEPVEPWGPTHHRDCPICLAPSDHTEVQSNQCIVTESALTRVDKMAFECGSCSGVWYLV